jgi:APA family basic amino acid/polyamine antiporter
VADSGLVRSLRLPQATALVVGTILGASVFVQASELTEHVPRIWAVLLAWSVSGVLTLFGALACAELASAFPRTGGVYVFLKETYSPVAGFLWGWAMFWVMHSGIIAAMATVFGRYAAFFVPLGDRGIRAVAVSAILGISALNYVGVKRGSAVQTAFTIAKRRVASSSSWLVVGSGPEHFRQGGAAAVGWTFLLALIAGLFAFGG